MAATASQVAPGSPVGQALAGNMRTSWADVAQGKKTLSKYDLQISVKDGISSGVVPADVFNDSGPLWEDYVIGTFLATAPHVAKVHAIVNKIWALGDKSQMIDVIIINSTTMKFKISNPTIRNRVLRRGMWNLAEIPVVISKWTPYETEASVVVKTVPLWVHLKNVPLDMFSWKGLSCISSLVGEPDRLHPDTAQCRDFEIAKVFVKADLTKELPTAMIFTSPEGIDTLVQYSYPWLPARCSTCEKWGHQTSVCKQSTSSATASSSLKENANLSTLKQSIDNGSKVLTAAVVSGPVEENTENVVMVDGTKENQNELPVPNSNPLEEEQEEGEWQTILPGKGSRSPIKNMEYGQVSIMSQSRFLVLENEKTVESNGDEDSKMEEKAEVENNTKTKLILDDNTNQDKEGGDSYDDLHVEKETSQRPSLPRNSKDRHKFFSDQHAQKTKEVNPNLLNKRFAKKH